MKQKILGTGLTGLVGSRIVELLSEYEFENISRQTGCDITDFTQVLSEFKKSSANIVLHLGAYTNVDGAESQKNLEEKSEAWRVNVLGTENIIKAAEETGKKLIYISTDFVFDGKNPPEGGYTEENIPNPINWYAETKYEGELIVKKAKIPWLIVRIAYPYRASFEKNDFFRAIKDGLSQGQSVLGITDHIFCPTFVDDIASAIGTFIKKNITGIYHATGSQALTPFDAALSIADIFGFKKELITKTTREEYFNGKALRPFNLAMNNDKIKSLGVKMRGFKEGVIEIKKQISNL